MKTSSAVSKKSVTRGQKDTRINQLMTDLFEEVKVDAISLLFTNKEITLFESSGDGSDIHWRRTCFGRHVENCRLARAC